MLKNVFKKLYLTSALHFLKLLALKTAPNRDWGLFKRVRVVSRFETNYYVKTFRKTVLTQISCKKPQSNFTPKTVLA